MMAMLAKLGTLVLLVIPEALEALEVLAIVEEMLARVVRQERGALTLGRAGRPLLRIGEDLLN
jgi:hypothetical protein